MSEAVSNMDLDIEHPIVEAFPIMVDAAEQLCRPADNSDICYIYHRLWPYRRLAGAENRPLGQDAHIVQALRQMARESQLERILVSGSADYALLARVVYACRAEGIEPEVTVLDICEAPLRINRWYADRVEANVRTIRSDILEYSSETQFDAVVTDIFMTRLPVTVRSNLLDTWRNALRIGGRVVTTERVAAEYSNNPTGVRRVSAEEIEQRVSSLVSRAEKFRHMFPISLETLADYVRAYYAAQESYPFSSTEQLRALFKAKGFDVKSLIAAARKRPHTPEFWKRASYRIVAERCEIDAS